MEKKLHNYTRHTYAHILKPVRILHIGKAFHEKYNQTNTNNFDTSGLRGGQNDNNFFFVEIRINGGKDSLNLS